MHSLLDKECSSYELASQQQNLTLYEISHTECPLFTTNLEIYPSKSVIFIKGLSSIGSVNPAHYLHSSSTSVSM